MKKLIAVAAVALFSIGGIAFAQFMGGQAPLPHCQAPNQFKCAKDSLGLTAAECINPTTNAVVAKYVYSASDVTSIQNQEATEDALVNAVANAS